jgi:hypothetical protein
MTRVPQRNAVLAALVAVLVVATNAACARPAARSSSPEAPSVFTSALMLARATRPAVSDVQINALEKAAKSGQMSYEEISALLEDTFKCFDESGVDYRRLPDSEQVSGFKVPMYSYAEPVAIALACITKYNSFAWDAYQSQPKVGELRDVALKAEIPRVLACLRDHGVSIDDDATLDELRRASATLLSATSTGSSVGVICTQNM